MAPFTGKEFLESLRDGREVWIYGQRVADVTTHPAFRNPARMLARLYDALHDPAQRDVLTCPTDTGSGGVTHRYFHAPYQDNARRWYRLAQERVLYLNHALVQPPVDRNRPPDEVADVYVHVE